MIALCLGMAGSVWATLPLQSFTLAWQHTVEKVLWEEDYRLSERGLLLEEARVRGSGAGMEIPDEQLKALRGRCVQNVKKTGGSVTLDDAVRYQNGGL